MIRLLSRAAAAILAAALSVGACEVATAATKTPSIIVESTPAPKAAIAASEMMIDIHFNSKIDHRYSRLILLLPNGRQLHLVSLAAAPDHLSARASDLTPGDYTLRWQVVPVGKKMVKGDIPFTVK
jgi:copper resistance protein C